MDPGLMIRVLIAGYCFGIRSGRRSCEEVHLKVAYRWFCRLPGSGRRGLNCVACLGPWTKQSSTLVDKDAYYLPRDLAISANLTTLAIA
jgi:hypothetical protein